MLSCMEPDACCERQAFGVVNDETPLATRESNRDALSSNAPSSHVNQEWSAPWVSGCGRASRTA